MNIYDDLMCIQILFYIYISLNKVHGTSILFTCNSIVHVSEPSNIKVHAVKFNGGRNMVLMVYMKLNII